MTMGLKNLLRRKLRTFLTTLGIIIGTISIVVMVSIGIGMQKQMNDQFNQFGSIDIVTVNVTKQTAKHTNKKVKTHITAQDMKTFEKIDGVEGATPVISYTVHMITSDRLKTQTFIKGMNVAFLKRYGLDKVKQGRSLTEKDRYGVLFGKETLYDFKKSAEIEEEEDFDAFFEARKPPKFNPIGAAMYMSFGEEPIGNEDSTIQPVPITPIGVLATTNYLKSPYVYMDIEQLEELKQNYDKMTDYQAYGGKMPKNEGYTEVLLHVPDRNHIKKVQTAVRKMGFKTASSEEILKQTKSMNKIINMVFGGIGGISLLVAAIGITNTMVMAIYERRKEIGVMKVIGASLRDIKGLFLFESASIGFIGGVIGIVVSLLISAIVNLVAGNAMMGEMVETGTKMSISIIPGWLIVLALGFTAFIGLISGYMPAVKAMRLSALEAIKTD